MTDLEVVDNLDSSIDLEVDNLGVNTDNGVDLDLEVDTLEVNTDTEVDLGVHIEAGVDLEECIVPLVYTVLEVAPQTQFVSSPRILRDVLNNSATETTSGDLPRSRRDCLCNSATVKKF